MSVSATVSTSVQASASQFATGYETITNGSMEVLSVSAAGNNTSTTYSFPFTASKLLSIFVVTDEAVTLTFNGTSNPSGITTAYKPFSWTNNTSALYPVNPFGNNVTTLTVVNNTANTCNVTAISIENPV